MQAGQQVAIYIRVSTDKQVDGFSLEGQEAVIRKDIISHGETVYKVYIDAGVSGASQDRKGLERLCLKMLIEGVLEKWWYGV